MSDDISQLIGRLRSYARSSKGDIFAAVDTIEALRAERDSLKAEVERLRNEKVAGGVAVCGGDTAGKVESVHTVDLPNSGADIPAPATDPAPVCESEHEVNPHRPTYCPSCGLELDDLELDLLAAKRWRPRNE